MPRIANDTNALLADLQKRLERLVDTARKEGRNDALAEVRALVSGTVQARATGGAKKTARKKKRKNPWATMTKKEREDRIRKMLAGRGLKPKSERGKSSTRKRTSKTSK